MPLRRALGSKGSSFGLRWAANVLVGPDFRADARAYPSGGFRPREALLIPKAGRSVMIKHTAQPSHVLPFGSRPRLASRDRFGALAVLHPGVPAWIAQSGRPTVEVIGPVCDSIGSTAIPRSASSYTVDITPACRAPDVRLSRLGVGRTFEPLRPVSSVRTTVAAGRRLCLVFLAPRICIGAPVRRRSPGY